MIAQLIPLSGGDPITIKKDLTVVGRQREHCDIVVDRKSISKMHCILVRTDGLLFVRDLSSTNGTKVNGQRIQRGALLPGDQLALAGERFRVYLGPDEAVEVVGANNNTEMLSWYPPVGSYTNDSSSDVHPLADDLVE